MELNQLRLVPKTSAYSTCPTPMVYPYEESDPDPAVRSRILYPLSYRDIGGGRGKRAPESLRDRHFSRVPLRTYSSHPSIETWRKVHELTVRVLGGQ